MPKPTITGYNQKTFLDLFDQLISLPSVSSTTANIDQSNKPVIDLLAETLSNVGFNCESIPLLGNNNKFNLIATLGSGPGGLVLAGHTDTVPFDDPLWHVNPLQLSQKDNRLYGLGSCDMKGFFPIIVEAVKSYSGAVLKQPLIVLATADEESSMQGARELASLGRPKARYAVIGEPTGLKPISMHKGVMMESIRILGESGHSSDPANGKNALEAMHLVIAELISFRQELQSRYQNSLFEIDVPTLNLGSIHGGDNPNRICGHCDLEFDIRLLPNMDIDELRTQINRRICPIAEQFNVDIQQHSLMPGVPPFAAVKNSELLAVAEKLTGHAAETVAFGTEGPFLQQLGLDTIVLGPGDINMAHQPDEYLPLERVQPCIDLLKKLIVKFCL